MKQALAVKAASLLDWNFSSSMLRQHQLALTSGTWRQAPELPANLRLRSARAAACDTITLVGVHTGFFQETTAPVLSSLTGGGGGGGGGGGFFFGGGGGFLFGGGGFLFGGGGADL